MTDLLQWLNLLLIPTCMGVVKIVNDLAKVKATQQFHAQRLHRLDGIPN